ncbi:MAG: hypothetical protein NZT92_22325, partial [Abditibacteriales bacterium]|nr:hypothetical protein [Abditibacteriales bacterium]
FEDLWEECLRMDEEQEYVLYIHDAYCESAVPQYPSRLRHMPPDWFKRVWVCRLLTLKLPPQLILEYKYAYLQKYNQDAVWLIDNYCRRWLSGLSWETSEIRVINPRGVNVEDTWRLLQQVAERLRVERGITIDLSHFSAESLREMKPEFIEVVEELIEAMGIKWSGSCAAAIRDKST